MANIGIVGAGIGGLAFAIRMACAGNDVDVYESNAYPGGKLAEIRLGKYRFDAGPSLFTLPEYVDELFVLAGKNPRDYYTYSRLPEICSYFWDDKTRVKTYQEPAKTAEAIAEGLSESKQNISDFLVEIGENYDIISDLFLANSLHKLRTWTGAKARRGYANLHKLGLFSTMHEAHTARFRNEKTVQLFDRYATYNGSDPYQTPATLSIIPHLEYNLGAYFPEGGMVQIPRALHKLACELGVRFHFGQRVHEIMTEGNKAVGIATETGQFYFDYVASNSDIRPAYQNLMPRLQAPKKLVSQPKSSSGIIFYWGMDRTFDELGVHNIFFSKEYKAEFEAIFTHKTLLDDPTVYLHIASKVAPEDAPNGGEAWFLLINAPANDGQDWDALIAQTRTNIIQKISAQFGFDIEQHIVEEDYLDPRRIEERTSSSGGALYGNASNNRFAAFLRHPNYRPAIKNLYWIGGSVHPGGGIPLCLSSAKIAAQLFQENV